MKEFWDEKYSKPEFVYGTAPNDFFKEVIDKQIPGKILFPCEGEGRNAVYAASKCWNTFAFDYSVHAKEKAMQLAKLLGVTITYEVCDALNYKNPILFDAIVLIFAHFHPSIRQKIHESLIKMLEPGGIIVLEAFNTKQLGNQSGGPKSFEMLYSLDELNNDFSEMEISLLENKEIHLNEGRSHEGKADVIRMIARKLK